MHVLKRLLLAVIAYLVAVVIGLIAIIVVYLILSSMPGAPSYFSTLTLSPIVIIAAPPIGALVYGLAIVLTALPASVGALVSELFALRQAWLHGVMGAAIGGAAFVFASPLLLLGEIDGTDWADLAIVAGRRICRRPGLLADRRTQRRLPPAAPAGRGGGKELRWRTKVRGEPDSGWQVSLPNPTCRLPTYESELAGLLTSDPGAQLAGARTASVLPIAVFRRSSRS